jgi:membrane protein implicated in regulation of membrane protease activity
MHIEWWHWIIAGFCLIGLELLIPSFIIIWFGLGALAVGVLGGLWPGFPLAGQVALWSFASICFTAMWFKYLKPKSDRMRAGLSKEGIVGESGIIIRGTEESYGRGIVKFRIPVLGADEWDCYSDETLHVGDRVRVDDIEGHILKVEII